MPKSDKSPPSAPEGFAYALNSVADAQRRAVEAALRAQRDLAEGAAGAGAEAAAFARRRLQADLEAIRALAACRTPLDAAAVCAAAATAAWGDWMREGSALSWRSLDALRAAVEEGVAGPGEGVARPSEDGGPASSD
jgi:hypothetical protein